MSSSATLVASRTVRMLGILRRNEAREDRAIGMTLGNRQHVGQRTLAATARTIPSLGEPAALHVDGDMGRRVVQSALRLALDRPLPAWPSCGTPHEACVRVCRKRSALSRGGPLPPLKLRRKASIRSTTFSSSSGSSLLTISSPLALRSIRSRNASS